MKLRHEIGWSSCIYKIEGDWHAVRTACSSCLLVSFLLCMSFLCAVCSLEEGSLCLWMEVLNFQPKKFLRVRLARTRGAARWFHHKFLNDVRCKSKVSSSHVSCQSSAALSVRTIKLGKSTSSAFFWNADGKPHGSLKQLCDRHKKKAKHAMCFWVFFRVCVCVSLCVRSEGFCFVLPCFI